MAITIRIDKERVVTIELQARTSVDGNIMIFDHEDMDIVIVPEKNKCLALAKEKYTDKVYGAQDKLFEFMAKRGIIDPSTVRAGNVYGSIEAALLESKLPGVNNIHIALFVISEFLKVESKYFTSSSDSREQEIDHLINPSKEDSTELGAIPQSARKGTQFAKIRPYGYQYNYSLLREESENN